MIEGSSRLYEFQENINNFLDHHSQLRKIIGAWAISLIALGSGSLVVTAPEAQTQPLATGECVSLSGNCLPPGTTVPEAASPIATTSLPPTTLETTTTSEPPPTTLPAEAEPESTTIPAAQAPNPQVAAAAEVLPTWAFSGEGADQNWPSKNCESELPDGLQFGGVGLNQGHNFSINDCLEHEVERFKAAVGNNLFFYINTEYQGLEVVAADQHPDAANGCDESDPAHPYEECVARNYGYLAGQFTMDNFNAALYSPNIGVDAETGNYWSDNPLANRQSVVGELAAIEERAAEANLPKPHFVIYSTAYMYDQIFDDQNDPDNPHWANNYDVWLAGGTSDPEVARQKCTEPDFTGKLKPDGTPATPLMVQYVAPNPASDSNIDYDVTC